MFSALTTAITTAITAGSIAVCPPPPARRETCVHDGDTVWLAGEKIRLLEIDAPELNARNRDQRRLARDARARLADLLRKGEIKIERNGADCYGRTLARLITLEGSVSELLIAEGLAERYAGPVHPCGRSGRRGRAGRSSNTP